ncbi:hypothetical protein D4Q80_02080 [bacterium]|nr:MAG: hypothetical protein D4Q80_02080 [bacterium]
MKLQAIALALLFCFLVTTFGCDAFVRKFTRKSKKDVEVEKEMVLAPQEYKTSMSKEDYYRQYFLYWKSWQGELIDALFAGANHKKRLDSMNEAISNLKSMRALLNLEAQKKLDTYILKMEDLKGDINDDVYGTWLDVNRQKAEQIRRGILRDFSYSKIRASLL